MALDTTNVLATLAEAKLHLGYSAVSTYDTMIENMMNAAAAWCNTRTNRLLMHRLLTEFYDGDGGTSLHLRNYPVTGSATFELWLSSDDPRVYDSGTLVDADDIIKDDDIGLVRLQGEVLPEGARTVKAQYSAGFQIGSSLTLPWDLRHGFLELVRYWFEKWKSARTGITSTTVEGETIQYEKDVPKDIESIVDRYRRSPRLHWSH